MSILNVKFPTRKLVVFFVVETSNNMEDAKIEALNQAAEEAILLIRHNYKNNDNITIEIAVLQFSSGIKWSYPNPVPVESLSWQILTADGSTDFGAKCSELTLKLTKKGEGFMQNEGRAFAHVFILLTSGIPTDSYLTPLKTLKEKNWFKAGRKIAIAIGKGKVEHANFSAEFTGRKESVYVVDNSIILKKVIFNVCSIVSNIYAAIPSDKSPQEIHEDKLDFIINNQTTQQNTYHTIVYF